MHNCTADRHRLQSLPYENSDSAPTCTQFSTKRALKPIAAASDESYPQALAGMRAMAKETLLHHAHHAQDKIPRSPAASSFSGTSWSLRATAASCIRHT